MSRLGQEGAHRNRTHTNMDQEKINRQKSQRWANIEHTADYGDSWGYDDAFSGSDSEIPAVPSLPKLEIPSAIVGDTGSVPPSQEERRNSWTDESEEDEDIGTEVGHWKSEVLQKTDDIGGADHSDTPVENAPHDILDQEDLKEISVHDSIHDEVLSHNSALEQAADLSHNAESLDLPKLDSNAPPIVIPTAIVHNTNEEVNLSNDSDHEVSTEEPTVPSNVDTLEIPPIPNAPNLLPELKYGNHDWMDKNEDSDEFEETPGLWKKMSDLQRQLAEKSEQFDQPDSLADEEVSEDDQQHRGESAGSNDALSYNVQEQDLKLEQGEQEMEHEPDQMQGPELTSEDDEKEASADLYGTLQIPQPLRSHSSGSLSTGSWSVASYHKSVGDKSLAENSKSLNRYSSTLKSSNSEDDRDLPEMDQGDNNSFTLSNKLEALDIEHENRYDFSDDDVDHERYQREAEDVNSQDNGEKLFDNQEIDATSLEYSQQRGDSINFGHWRPDTSNFRDNFIKNEDLADRHTIFEEPEEVEDFEPDEAIKLPSNIDIDNISAVTSSLPGASLLDSRAEVKEVEDSYFKELDDSNDKIEVESPEDLNALKHENLLYKSRGSEDSGRGELINSISGPIPVSEQDKAPQQSYDYKKIMTMTNSRMKVEELSKARNIEYQVKTGLDEWLTFMLSSSSSDNNYQYQNDQLGPHARKAYEDVDQGNYHQHHQLSDLARKPSILNNYHTPKILKTSNRRLEKVGDIGKGIFSKGRKKILKGK